MGNKALFFDFDGVIIDAVPIKNDAVRELFAEYEGRVLNKIMEYQKNTGGISRYEKFRYIYANILIEPLPDYKLEKLAGKFSSIIKEKLIKAAVIPGVIDFIFKYKKRYKTYIVSGTPQHELEKLVEARGWSSLFNKICGSPPGKSLLLQELIDSEGIAPYKSILFGDAIVDMNAANDNDVSFVLVDSQDNAELKQVCPIIIADFINFEL